MIRSSDLSLQAVRYLLSCHGECEWLDFKVELHLENDKELSDFTKDVIGMKNVGGGYLLIGVEDKTWLPRGLAAQLPCDTKMLRDKVRSCSGLDIDLDIVHHEVYVENSTRTFAFILVRASKRQSRRRVPFVVKQDFQVKTPYALRRGEIYVRRGDSTTKLDSQEQLSDLLDALESQADLDAIEKDVNRSPFAIEDGTYKLLDRGFETYIGRDTLRKDLVATVMRDPRIWIVNVHGPGGVGKSALVNWATYEFYEKRQFEAIFQLTAKERVLSATGIQPLSPSLYSIESLLQHILNTFQEDIPGDILDQKRIATDLLSVWRTLLVLDNMETVTDGRILAFVQGLPPETRAKVLMTSRTKTGGWELPFPVQPLSNGEVKEFLFIKAKEVGVQFPMDDETCAAVATATGGLPLALQWALGSYRLTGSVDKVIVDVARRDSPVLEFSFRNIWQSLPRDARTLLALTSIFEQSPSVQMFAIATQWPQDRIDEGLFALEEVTLLSRTVRESDGRTVFVGLPITLAFARHQLGEMLDFVDECRERIRVYTQRMALEASESARYRNIFEQFGLRTDNEQRAAILCQMGQSEAYRGNLEGADMHFTQALELAPQSAYVTAMTASYELSKGELDKALKHINRASGRVTKLDGALVYTIKARIHEARKERRERVKALARAVDYDPNDVVVRHQYGVALSLAGETQSAIQQFSIIIENEMTRTPRRSSLLFALNTRILNLRRVGRDDEADRDVQFALDVLRDNPHLDPRHMTKIDSF